MAWFRDIFQSLFKKETDSFSKTIYEITGISPKDISLYHLAFKHKSKHKENNERLEFLGDSILDAVISEIIYKQFPDKSEGDLSKLRAKLVSRAMLNKMGNKLGLLQHLSYRETHTSEGLMNTEGNTLEALVGALYLDQGYPYCKQFIDQKLIAPFVDWNKLQNKEVDHKSTLFQYCQKNKWKLQFDLLEEDSTNNEQRFHIALKINGVQQAEAYGKSKKVAEQLASKKYLATIA